MSTASFKLDMFEGPLDLLLHLINKHKLNIYDIEIAVLLEQYLEYMAGLEEEDYEDAADFLEMAARLIYIKTVSLLPKDNEGEELKKELQGSLIEYSLCKMAAQRLKEQYSGGNIFVREPVKLPVDKTFTGEREPEELLEAYLGMSEKARKSKPLKADMFKPIISHRIVSVTSKIIHVLKMLITKGECFLDSMYDGCADKSERVAVFLAVLELTKSGRIFLNDDNTRVYMNSAAKKKRIESDFDKAEQEAQEAAAEANAAPDGVGVTAEEIPAEERAEQAFDEENPCYAEPEEREDELILPPYRLSERTERTVYKSETKQRGNLPVLRIELSPELQRIVSEGKIESDDEAAAVPAEGEKPVEAGAEVGGEVLKAEESEAVGEVPAEGGKPVEAGAEVGGEALKAEESEAVGAVPAEGEKPVEAGAEVGGEVLKAEESKAVKDAEDVGEDRNSSADEVHGQGSEEERTVDMDNGGIEREEFETEILLAEDERRVSSYSKAEISDEEEARIDENCSPYPVRPNFFAGQYYWGKQCWALGRLRVR
ncbi:segregation/condensation protein A [Ruminococcus sp.]|uniref:segregation and condensation protein A n=1 Tax=Ruminococcus sp. TaxID=41978 RepID=UPI0025D2D710|nr:segregation/condensation protein A [Ruminococcus sp.]MBQ8965676.1 segregation/condensation protein A [Ruminococcus sp.]